MGGRVPLTLRNPVCYFFCFPFSAFLPIGVPWCRVSECFAALSVYASLPPLTSFYRLIWRCFAGRVLSYPTQKPLCAFPTVLVLKPCEKRTFWVWPFWSCLLSRLLPLMAQRRSRPPSVCPFVIFLPLCFFVFSFLGVPLLSLLRPVRLELNLNASFFPPCQFYSFCHL